ncbi:uncharacterized protein LOC112491691 isoform X2 [Ziziphus jujuba]|uniref:Uncharacterized protein LOC112491691 isoform X2 n=1 Tax=Ziziphus jujuba TaxID=326968 RepID=A0ABM4A019_ZIZJJ|nr:uncharacterized protein LOC112491691 isoform X2 [Ziziphus jujuba]
MEQRPRRKSKQIDFLSELADHIFHKIISLLNIDDVARVSTLSKRCRKNCLSSPFLTLSLEKIYNDKFFYRFCLFLQRFLYLRNGIDIHTFKVKIYSHFFYDDIGFHIGDWVLEASRLHVKKICLNLINFNIFTLPSGVLNSACLRDLEVCLGLNGLRAHLFIWGLQNLKLVALRVSLKFDEWISSCKSLKKLCLDVVSVQNGLNISSSSLEDLILEDIVSSARDFNIKVSARRLKNLRIFCPPDFKHEALDNGIIGKVLRSMHRVSSMSIHDCSIKGISSQALLPEFYDLHSLTIIGTDFGNKTPSIASLLNSMPHLNTLKIQETHNGLFEGEKICYTAEYWESQNLKFVHSLKELEVEINGEQNEIELIKYLLKNAKAMKTISIHYSRYACSVPRRLSEISRKIQQFEIASSSVTIYFFYRDELSSWNGRNFCKWWGISCESNAGAVIAVNPHNPYPQNF